MIATLRIGTETRNFAEVSESWNIQQIRRRRNDAQPVCVELFVNTAQVNVRLATAGCGAASGGGGAPNRLEAKVISLWSKSHIDHGDLAPGKLVALYKRVRQLINA